VDKIQILPNHGWIEEPQSSSNAAFPRTLHNSRPDPSSRDCHATVEREPGRQAAGSKEQRRTVSGSQSSEERKENALSANR
ncbi:unnamed protein product, partial [Ectocarpus sp. 6 AP-2014]